MVYQYYFKSSHLDNVLHMLAMKGKVCLLEHFYSRLWFSYLAQMDKKCVTFLPYNLLVADDIQAFYGLFIHSYKHFSIIE